MKKIENGVEVTEVKPSAPSAPIKVEISPIVEPVVEAPMKTISTPTEDETRAGFQSAMSRLQQRKSNEAKTLNERKAAGKRRWEDLEYEESVMVKGKFMFHECPNGTLRFVFDKFGSDFSRYEMTGGETYEVPLAVARHLNSNLAYPNYAWKKTEKGLPKCEINEYIRRASFVPLAFM